LCHLAVSVFIIAPYGHARGAHAACGMVIEGAHVENFERAERLARASLDDATFAELVAEGRYLDDAAADRLALGAPERPPSPLLTASAASPAPPS
jgi:hypothetical protein